MKKFSKKGVVLFAGVMAVCAFVMPSMASAASWGVIGTAHTLHSPDLEFTTTVPVVGAITSQCTDSTFTTDVRSAAVLTVTTATFMNCTATGPTIGRCTVTATATPSPTPDWNVTGITTSNITIDNLHVDVTFENTIGTSDCTGVNGASITLTGSLAGGQWSGNAAGQRAAVFANDEGLTSHGPTGSSTVTVSGTIKSTTALTLT